MAMAPQVTVIGRLVAEPELRFTASGAAVCALRIANTPRKLNKQTQVWEDQTTLWLSASVWRQMGENVAESLEKGLEIIVVGRLTQRDYTTKDGEKRSSIEIDVDAIGPNLAYATARVAKAARSGEGAKAKDEPPWTGAPAADGQPASWEQTPVF